MKWVSTAHCQVEEGLTWSLSFWLPNRSLCSTLPWQGRQRGLLGNRSVAVPLRIRRGKGKVKTKTSNLARELMVSLWRRVKGHHRFGPWASRYLLSAGGFLSSWVLSRPAVFQSSSLTLNPGTHAACISF